MASPGIRLIVDRPRPPGRPARTAMASPATTKPRLLSVLTGCSSGPADTSQKTAPRSTSGPSQPDADGQREQAEAGHRGGRGERHGPGHGASGSGQVDHGEVRSPARVVTTWTVTPRHLHDVRRDQVARPGQRRELALEDRHHQPGPPLVPAHVRGARRGVRRERGAQGRARWQARGAASRRRPARARCRCRAAGSSRAPRRRRARRRPLCRREGRRGGTASAPPRRGRTRAAGGRRRSSSGAIGPASGRAASRQAGSPRATTPSIAEPRSDQNSETLPSPVGSTPR